MNYWRTTSEARAPIYATDTVYSILLHIVCGTYLKGKPAESLPVHCLIWTSLMNLVWGLGQGCALAQYLYICNRLCNDKTYWFSAGIERLHTHTRWFFNLTCPRSPLHKSYQCFCYCYARVSFRKYVTCFYYLNRSWIIVYLFNIDDFVW